MLLSRTRPRAAAHRIAKRHFIFLPHLHLHPQPQRRQRPLQFVWGRKWEWDSGRGERCSEYVPGKGWVETHSTVVEQEVCVCFVVRAGRRLTCAV